jgi:hypothetical protein
MKLIQFTLASKGPHSHLYLGFYPATLLDVVGPTIVGAYTAISTHGLVQLGC